MKGANELSGKLKEKLREIFQFENGNLGFISQTELQLSPEVIKEGKKIIEKMKNKHVENIKKRSKAIKPIYDEIYFNAIEYLDEEDLSETWLATGKFNSPEVGEEE